MSSLKTDVLDAIIDGKLGNGIVVTRKEVINAFPNRPESYTGVILSNSEVDADHSDWYERFAIRVADGTYRIHPQALLERMRERKLI